MRWLVGTIRSVEKVPGGELLLGIETQGGGTRRCLVHETALLAKTADRCELLKLPVPKPEPGVQLSCRVDGRAKRVYSALLLPV